MQYTREFFANLQCPTSVTWTNDIKGFFTALDINHMKQINSINLSDYDSVKLWAHKIYSEVAAHAMPPASSGEPAWSNDKVATFGCWIKQGCPQ